MVHVPDTYSYTILVKVYHTYQCVDGVRTRVHMQTNVGEVQNLE